MRKSARLTPEELAPYLLAATDPPTILDWSAVFGNPNPVEIEVGSGKGLFLLNASAACPEVNFVGIEIERKYALFTATRMAKRQRRNVRMVCADARQFFLGSIRTNSVQAVHVYFPDPWWKRRHHKRRLFTEGFASECARVLGLGGKLYLVTDVPEYFAVMGEVMATRPEMCQLPPPPEKGPESEMDYLTNFERKFRLEGKPIHRALYERVSPRIVRHEPAPG